MAARDYYNPPAYSSNNGSASPFETPFDDHYNRQYHQAPDPISSQSSFAQDTGYHSHSPGDVSPMGRDDIPLRSHQDGSSQKIDSPSGVDAMAGNDHVYDTSDRPRKKARIRFGELGMLGANNKKRIPFFVYFFTVAQIAVFIGEIVKNTQLTGSPIEVHPSFNVMIGPSPEVLINMGSRYVICMHNVEGIQDASETISWPCPNSTTSDLNSPEMQCTLSQLCGFGGVPNPTPNGSINDVPFPNQWWRFIIPIFMHAGIIHIGFNLLLQLTLGKEMERAIGSIRFFLVYMSSGIFGFVMGGNFAATGISSTGCSGSLFGIIALTLLDLFYSWKDRANPMRELMYILVETVVSFVLGLLPGLDNFSHIGGFLMGICLGICVLHSPNALRERIGEDHFANTSYASVNGGVVSAAFPPFMRDPVGFFRGRKGLWWAWWLLRAGLLVFIIVVFILLLNNFYWGHKTCGWCKYLSCLPINGWCDVGNISLSNSTSKRGIEAAFEHMARMAKIQV